MIRPPNDEGAGKLWLGENQNRQPQKSGTGDSRPHPPGKNAQRRDQQNRADGTAPDIQGGVCVEPQGLQRRGARDQQKVEHRGPMDGEAAGGVDARIEGLVPAARGEKAQGALQVHVAIGIEQHAAQHGAVAGNFG